VGAGVGVWDGNGEGILVGQCVGAAVGSSEGVADGACVGLRLGAAVGAAVGAPEGTPGSPATFFSGEAWARLSLAWAACFCLPASFFSNRADVAGLILSISAAPAPRASARTHSSLEHPNMAASQNWRR
jgi:hypothetical protein